MREWLVAIREKKRLSQKDVSEKVGISQPSYNNIEHGIPGKGPSVSTAKKISEVLNYRIVKSIINYIVRHLLWRNSF